MADFDAEPREGCKCVDDQSTAIASMVVTLVRTGRLLRRTVDTDWVGNSLVLAPRMRLARLERVRGFQCLYLGLTLWNSE
ncbi:hypothetical protein SAMN05421752_11839 [Natronorubrum thiooxidans]|uniref:Uncharacterized protein n=1 Tax=Natronorubrum thiooxidans TaxID=308853 RepID=A0A1N7GZ40_9EURY|nr:hypothetical protein SAMN05421752_11839 [Natronorubrum thiooxidans]